MQFDCGIIILGLGIVEIFVSLLFYGDLMPWTTPLLVSVHFFIKITTDPSSGLKFLTFLCAFLLIFIVIHSHYSYFKHSYLALSCYNTTVHLEYHMKSASMLHSLCNVTSKKKWRPVTMVSTFANNQ